MKTRILSLIIILTMTLGFLPTVAVAETVTSGTCGENVTWSFDEASQTITFDGTGEMTRSGQLPYRHLKSKIHHVVINEGVTSVCSAAFHNYSNVETVSLAKTVSYIEEWSFANCVNLTKITIPGKDVTLAGANFSGCTGLETIEITGNVTYIGGSTFENCTSLKSFAIPEGITSIKDSLFGGCTTLESLTMPDSVTSIGNRAFYNCKSLTSISLSKNITSIGEGVFTSCTGLTEIKLPDKLESIGMRAFSLCSKITSITLPGSLKTIGSHLFSYCSQLEEVILGNGITSISVYMFDNCPALTSVTIPDSVTSIGIYAFYECAALESVVLPEKLTAIGENAFFGCESLLNITVPAGIKKIETGTFRECLSLESATVKGSLSSIGKYSFMDCTALTSVTVEGNVTSLADNSFTSCSSLETFTIKGTVTNIGNFAFWGCSALENLNIKGIRTIGDGAFVECKKLESFPFADGLYSIGVQAFYECRKLKKAAIVDSVKYIGNQAFYGCTSLESVVISKNLSTIDANTFGCSKIKDLYLPKEIKSLDVKAFKDATVERVYYSGTSADRENILNLSENEPLLEAEWIYNYGHVHKYNSNCDDECVVCGEKREAMHTFSQYISDNNATTEADGTKTRYCLYCDAKETVTDVGSKLHTHSYTNACDSICNGCGASREVVHAYGAYQSDNNATAKKDGTKTRVCSVCGYKDTVTDVGTKWHNPFVDVKTKDFYYTATLWAVRNNITKGTSTTTFEPNKPCTRGEIVTFLWRAAGSPEPKATTMSFTDVGSKAFYKKAVLWAVEQGITSGTSATTFSPNETCTRGQIATFLWRAKGKPAPKSSNMPFVDVAAKNFAYKAVLWAVENKITSGTSKTTFEPSKPCTRGQIVTFLYRAYK